MKDRDLYSGINPKWLRSGLCFHRIPDADIEDFLDNQRQKIENMGIYRSPDGIAQVDARVRNGVREHHLAHNMLDEVVERIDALRRMNEENIYLSRSEREQQLTKDNLALPQLGWNVRATNMILPKALSGNHK